MSNWVRWWRLVIWSGIEEILLPFKFTSFSVSIWKMEGNSVNWLWPLFVHFKYILAYNDNFLNLVRFLKQSAGKDWIALFDKTRVFNSLRMEMKAISFSLLLFNNRHCNLDIFAKAKSGRMEIRLLPKFKNTKFSRANIPRIPFPDNWLYDKFKYVNSVRFPKAYSIKTYSQNIHEQTSTCYTINQDDLNDLSTIMLPAC